MAAVALMLPAGQTLGGFLCWGLELGPQRPLMRTFSVDAAGLQVCQRQRKKLFPKLGLVKGCIDAAAVQQHTKL